MIPVTPQALRIRKSSTWGPPSPSAGATSISRWCCSRRRCSSGAERRRCLAWASVAEPLRDELLQLCRQRLDALRQQRGEEVGWGCPGSPL